MKTALLGILLALPSGASAQSRSTDTFVHLTSRVWETLDPANAFDAVSFILAGNVYEPLIAFESAERTDRFQPFLASEVPTLENGLLSKDRLTYTFPIRKGVRFHDGSELAPEDVRYSLLRFMLMDSEGGPASLLLRPILGVFGTRDETGKVVLRYGDAADAVRVVGDAVVVKLVRPDHTFLKTLASLPIVVSKTWAAGHGDWDGTEGTWLRLNGRASDAGWLSEHMNGTGPFMLARADREAREIVLRRNDSYWRAPAALRKLVLQAEPNGGLRLFMLETGDADGAYLEHSYAHYARSLKGLRVVEDPPSNHLGEMIFFNFAIDPKDNDYIGSGQLDGRGIPPDFFADPDVRKAFCFAFDYERYFKEALGSKGVRAAGPFPPGMLKAKPAYETDIKKAEERFRSAKIGPVWDKGFLVRVGFSAENQERQIAAEVLKQSLERLNPKFKVHLHPIPAGKIYGEIESRRLPLFVSGDYADYPDPQAFAFSLLHSKGYFPKFQGYSSPDTDALVERAVAETDAAKLGELYRRLNDAAASDAPEIYTYAPMSLKVFGGWVQGVETPVNISNFGFNGFPYFYAYSKSAR